MQLDGAARTAAVRRRRSEIVQSLRVRNAGVVYAYALLVVAMTLVTSAAGRSGYLSEDNFANILDQAALTGILAVFMTITLISGNFDLSVGSVAALSAAVCLSVIDEHGLVIAATAALLSGGLVGLLNGVIVQLVGINAFIVTLGTLTAVRGLVLVLTDARTISVATAQADRALSAVESGSWITPDLLLVAGILLLAVCAMRIVARRRLEPGAGLLGAVGAVLALASPFASARLELAKPAYYMLAVAVAGWAVLRFTVVGRRLYAVGGNAEAARLSGIHVNRYRIGAFVLNGLAAGFVGVLFAAKLGAVNPTALQGMELTVLAAAILGGTSLFGGSGSVLKSVVGALFLFTLANGFNVLNLGATYQKLIEGTVIVIAAAVYTIASRRPSSSQTAATELAAQEPELAPRERTTTTGAETDEGRAAAR